MSRVLKERIESVEKIAKSIYKMTVKSEYISVNSRPGQFVNVKCCEGLNALLRRPISICSADVERGTFDIVFQVKGIGTEYLSQKSAGSEVDLIGPLGKPFHISRQYKRIAVVGGGIGIFPLLYLLREMKDADKSAFLGFRSSDYVVLMMKRSILTSLFSQNRLLIEDLLTIKEKIIRIKWFILFLTLKTKISNLKELFRMLTATMQLKDWNLRTRLDFSNLSWPPLI